LSTVIYTDFGVRQVKQGTPTPPSPRPLDSEEQRYKRAVLEGRSFQRKLVQDGQIYPRKKFKGNPQTDPTGKYERLLWIRHFRRRGFTIKAISEALGLSYARTRLLVKATKRLRLRTKVVLVGKFPNLWEREVQTWELAPPQ
jgi:hypothetical protein